jgi:Na+-translocating ferredoxin:NAD+ oxidoreductase RnfG subunit
VPFVAEGKVYYSKSEALASAFPGADQVESRTVALNDEQVSAIESLANARLETKLITVYTGVKDDEIVGYAFIDIHTVRTLPEAFLIVLSPEGEIESLRVLAFYEPEEYLATERWLAQFHQRVLDSELRLGGEIHGIAGATLSARAVTDGVRRSLAIFELLVRTKQGELRSGGGGR